MYKREIEIVKLKHDVNITFPQALRCVQNRTSISYATTTAKTSHTVDKLVTVTALLVVAGFVVILQFTYAILTALASIVHTALVSCVFLLCYVCHGQDVWM